MKKIRDKEEGPIAMITKKIKKEVIVGIDLIGIKANKTIKITLIEIIEVINIGTEMILKKKSTIKMILKNPIMTMIEIRDHMMMIEKSIVKIILENHKVIIILKEMARSNQDFHQILQIINKLMKISIVTDLITYHIRERERMCGLMPLKSKFRNTFNSKKNKDLK